MSTTQATAFFVLFLAVTAIALALRGGLLRPGTLAARVAPLLFAAYVAFVFIWYLQYKWTAHPGSVHLFTVLTDWSGLPFEPYGRVWVGVCELIAGLLALVPATRPLGGLGAIGVMSGAIFFHLFTPLGVDPYDDGGVLFTEACAVWLSGVAILILDRERVRRLLALVGIEFPGLGQAAR
jgi:hypothetical protein